MMLWRVVRRSRWPNTSVNYPNRAVEAAKDLMLRPDEAGLSLFQVADIAEADRVARLFALTCRDCPKHLDYLLIPPAFLAALPGVQLLAVPDAELYPYLAARHYEAWGLTGELSEQLAVALLNQPDLQVPRLNEKSLREVADEMIRQESALKSFLGGQWPSLLRDAGSQIPPTEL